MSTDTKAIGWCYNVPITFANKALPRDTDFTMMHDLIVVDYEKHGELVGSIVLEER